MIIKNSKVQLKLTIWVVKRQILTLLHKKRFVKENPYNDGRHSGNIYNLWLDTE